MRPKPYNLTLRITSLVVAVAFAFTTIWQDFVWAYQPAKSTLNRPLVSGNFKDTAIEPETDNFRINFVKAIIIKAINELADPKNRGAVLRKLTNDLKGSLAFFKYDSSTCKYTFILDDKLLDTKLDVAIDITDPKNPKVTIADVKDKAIASKEVVGDKDPDKIKRTIAQIKRLMKEKELEKQWKGLVGLTKQQDKDSYEEALVQLLRELDHSLEDVENAKNSPNELKRKQEEINSILLYEENPRLQYEKLFFSYLKEPALHIAAMDEMIKGIVEKKSKNHCEDLIDKIFEQVSKEVFGIYLLHEEHEKRIKRLLREIFEKRATEIKENFVDQLFDTHTTKWSTEDPKDLTNSFKEILKRGSLTNMYKQRQAGIPRKPSYKDDTWAGSLTVSTYLGSSSYIYGDVILELDTDFLDRQKDSYYFPEDKPWGEPKPNREEFLTLYQKLKEIMNRDDAKRYVASEIAAFCIRKAIQSGFDLDDISGLVITENLLEGYLSSHITFGTVESKGRPEGHFRCDIPLDEGVRAINVPEENFDEIKGYIEELKKEAESQNNHQEAKRFRTYLKKLQTYKKGRKEFGDSERARNYCKGLPWSDWRRDFEDVLFVSNKNAVTVTQSKDAEGRVRFGISLKEEDTRRLNLFLEALESRFKGKWQLEQNTFILSQDLSRHESWVRQFLTFLHILGNRYAIGKQALSNIIFGRYNVGDLTNLGIDKDDAQRMIDDGSAFFEAFDRLMESGLFSFVLPEIKLDKKFIARIKNLELVIRDVDKRDIKNIHLVRLAGLVVGLDDAQQDKILDLFEIKNNSDRLMVKELADKHAEIFNMLREDKIPSLAQEIKGSPTELSRLDSIHISKNTNRIVAIGDIHTQIDELKGILQKSNIIDEEGNWIAERGTTLVQVGDLIGRKFEGEFDSQEDPRADRLIGAYGERLKKYLYRHRQDYSEEMFAEFMAIVEGDESKESTMVAALRQGLVGAFLAKEVIDLFMDLEEKAKEKGYEVVVLLGNHELDLLSGIKRYYSLQHIYLLKLYGLEGNHEFHRKKNKTIETKGTLGDFIEAARGNDEQVLERLRKENKFIDWLLNRKFAAKVNNIFFIHGGPTKKLIEEFRKKGRVILEDFDVILTEARERGFSDPMFLEGGISPFSADRKDDDFVWNEKLAFEFLNIVECDFLAVGHSPYLAYPKEMKVDTTNPTILREAASLSRLGPNKGILKLDTDLKRKGSGRCLVIDYKEKSMDVVSVDSDIKNSLFVKEETLDRPYRPISKLRYIKDVAYMLVTAYNEVQKKHKPAGQMRKWLYGKIADALEGGGKKIGEVIENIDKLMKEGRRPTIEELKALGIPKDQMGEIITILEGMDEGLMAKEPLTIDEEETTPGEPKPVYTSIEYDKIRLRLENSHESIMVAGLYKKYKDDTRINMLMHRRTKMTNALLECIDEIKRYKQEGSTVEDRNKVLSEDLKDLRKIDAQLGARFSILMGLAIDGFMLDEFGRDISDLLNLFSDERPTLLVGSSIDFKDKLIQEVNILKDGSIKKILYLNKTIFLIDRSKSSQLITSTELMAKFIELFPELSIHKCDFFFLRKNTDVILAKYLCDNPWILRNKDILTDIKMIAQFGTDLNWKDKEGKFVYQIYGAPEPIKKASYTISGMIHRGVRFSDIRNRVGSILRGKDINNPQTGQTYYEDMIGFLKTSEDLLKESEVTTNGRVIAIRNKEDKIIHILAILRELRKWFKTSAGKEFKKSEAIIRTTGLIQDDNFKSVAIGFRPDKYSGKSFAGVIKSLNEAEKDERVKIELIKLGLKDEREIEKHRKLLAITIEREVGKDPWAGDIFRIIYSPGKSYSVLSLERIIEIVTDDLEKQEKEQFRLIGDLKDSDKQVRAFAARRLADFRNELSLEALLEALKDRSGLVKREAVLSLGILGYNDNETILKIVARLRDSDEQVRWMGAYALGQIGYNLLIRDELEKMLSSYDKNMWTLASLILKEEPQYLKDKSIQKHLIKALYSRIQYIQNLAIINLGRLKYERHIDEIKRFLHPEVPTALRECAILALANIGSERAFRFIRMDMHDQDEYIQRLIISILKEHGFLWPGSMDKPQINLETQDKFLGAMVGAAIGDALGAPVEGLTSEIIEKKFGKVDNYIVNEKRRHLLDRGQYTDDTELFLELAESLVSQDSFSPYDISQRFANVVYNMDSRLKGNPGYGQASIFSSRLLYAGVNHRLLPQRFKGIGSAMSVTPLALFNYDNIDNLVKQTKDFSSITYGQDRISMIAAAIVAYTIAKAVKLEGDFDRRQFLVDMANFIEQHFPDQKRLANEIGMFIFYLHPDVNLADALKELKKDKGPMPIVKAALLIFLNSPNDFRASLINAVNSGGDTDTLASIVGAISGAYNGLEAIPPELKEDLYDSYYIKKVATELYQTTAQRKPSTSLEKIAKESKEEKPSQIGKGAKVDTVTLSDDKKTGTAEVNNDTGEKIGNLGFNLRENFTTDNAIRIIEKSLPADEGHKRTILGIVELLQNSPPQGFYEFNQLYEDLFGFARPQDSLIALHQVLGTNPVALFHEIAEYLIRLSVLGFRLSDKNTLIVSISGEELIEINLSNDTLNSLRNEDENKDKWLDWPQERLNLPENQHYLLRILQREIFKGLDEELTQKIKGWQIIGRFNSLTTRKLEYGLIGGVMSKNNKPVYEALCKILSENGFDNKTADRLAQTIARMKEGSLEIMYITGIISKQERDIFVTKDVTALKHDLNKQAQKNLASRLKRLVDSYDQALIKEELTEAQKTNMMKRLIPLEIINPLAYGNDTSRSNIFFIISIHADFPVWLYKAKAKAQEIKDKVGGLRNAWHIIIGQGLDKVDSWVKLAEEKVNSIKDKVRGPRNAWFIIIVHGLFDKEGKDKIGPWVDKAEEKVNAIKDRVGGPINAWEIVIRQGLADKDKEDEDKIGPWVDKAEKIVDAIKYKVGGSYNAWFIVISQGPDKITLWLKVAEEKVNAIKKKVRGSSNAWDILIKQGLDNVDSWVESAEKCVKNMVNSGKYTESEAWKYVIAQGLEGSPTTEPLAIKPTETDLSQINKPSHLQAFITDPAYKATDQEVEANKTNRQLALLGQLEGQEKPEGTKITGIDIAGNNVNIVIHNELLSQLMLLYPNLSEKETIQQFIQDSIKARAPNYKELYQGIQKDKTLYLDLLDRSPTPFGNDRNDGYIYVNKIIFEKLAKNYRPDLREKIIKALLMIGISHELRHEAGFDNEEELTKEDVNMLMVLGISLVSIQSALSPIAEGRFIEKIKEAFPARRKSNPSISKLDLLKEYITLGEVAIVEGEDNFNPVATAPRIGREEFIYLRDDKGQLQVEPIGFAGTWVVRLTNEVREDISQKNINAAVNRITKSIATVVQNRWQIQDLQMGHIYVLDDINDAVKYRPSKKYYEYRTDRIVIYVEDGLEGKKKIQVCITGDLLTKRRNIQQEMLTQTLEMSPKEGISTLSEEKFLLETPIFTEKPLGKNPKVLIFNYILAEESGDQIYPAALFLGSALKHEGIEVKISTFPIKKYILLKQKVDLEDEEKQELEKLTQELSNLLAQDYDVIGMSCYLDSGIMSIIKNFIEDIRSNYKTESLIAVGGPLPTVAPEHILAHIRGIDILFRGEGDIAFPKLVNIISQNRGQIDERIVEEIKGVDGLWLRSNNLFVINNLDSRTVLSREEFNKIKLDFSFLNIEDIKKDGVHLIFSRGCPKLCVFCSKVHGYSVRQWTAEKVVDTIKNYQSWLDSQPAGTEDYPNAFDIWLGDDDILLNPKRIEEILIELRELHGKGELKVDLFALQTSIESFFEITKNKERQLNMRLIEKLSSAADLFGGSLYGHPRSVVLVGTDAFTDEEIKRLAKGNPLIPYTFKDIKLVVEALEKAKVVNAHYLILTNPWTTDKDLAQTIENLLEFFKISPEYFSIVNCNPYVIPNQFIEIYKQVQKQGIEEYINLGAEYKLQGFEEYDFFEGKSITPPMLSYFKDKVLDIANLLNDKLISNTEKALKLQEILKNYYSSKEAKVPVIQPQSTPTTKEGADLKRGTRQPQPPEDNDGLEEEHLKTAKVEAVRENIKDKRSQLYELFKGLEGAGVDAEKREKIIEIIARDGTKTTKQYRMFSDTYLIEEWPKMKDILFEGLTEQEKAELINKINMNILSVPDFERSVGAGSRYKWPVKSEDDFRKLIDREKEGAVKVLKILVEALNKYGGKKPVVLIQNKSLGSVYPPISGLSEEFKDILGIFKPTDKEIDLFVNDKADELLKQKFNNAKIIVFETYVKSTEGTDIEKFVDITANISRVKEKVSAEDVFFADHSENIFSRAQDMAFILAPAQLTFEIQLINARPDPRPDFQQFVPSWLDNLEWFTHEDEGLLLFDDNGDRSLSGRFFHKKFGQAIEEAFKNTEEFKKMHSGKPAQEEAEREGLEGSDDIIGIEELSKKEKDFAIEKIKEFTKKIEFIFPKKSLSPKEERFIDRISKNNFKLNMEDKDHLQRNEKLRVYLVLKRLVSLTEESSLKIFLFEPIVHDYENNLLSFSDLNKGAVYLMKDFFSDPYLREYLGQVLFQRTENLIFEDKEMDVYPAIHKKLFGAQDSLRYAIRDFISSRLIDKKENDISKTARKINMLEIFMDRVKRFIKSFAEKGVVGFMSDIHGNARRLKLFLDHLKERGLRRLILLGDYFDRDRHSVTAQGTVQLSHKEKPEPKGTTIHEYHLRFCDVLSQKYTEKVNKIIDKSSLFAPKASRSFAVILPRPTELETNKQNEVNGFKELTTNEKDTLINSIKAVIPKDVTVELLHEERTSPRGKPIHNYPLRFSKTPSPADMYKVKEIIHKSGFFKTNEEYEFISSIKAVIPKDVTAELAQELNVDSSGNAKREYNLKFSKALSQQHIDAILKTVNESGLFGSESSEIILSLPRQLHADEEGRLLKLATDSIPEEVPAVFTQLKKIKEELKDNAIFLWGNHDICLVWAILFGNRQAFKIWMTTYEGNEFLKEALGVDIKAWEIADGNEDYLTELFNKARDSELLKEVAQWLKDNLRLYHIEDGMLCVHSGIPIDEQGNLNIRYKGLYGLDALRLMDEDLRNCNTSDDYLDYLFDKLIVDTEGDYDFTRNSVVECGKVRIKDKIIEWEKAVEELSLRMHENLGIFYILTGHKFSEDLRKGLRKTREKATAENRTISRRIGEAYEYFKQLLGNLNLKVFGSSFGIDFGMAEGYLAMGASIEFASDGIHIYFGSGKGAESKIVKYGKDINIRYLSNILLMLLNNEESNAYKLNEELYSLVERRISKITTARGLSRFLEFLDYDKDVKTVIEKSLWHYINESMPDERRDNFLKIIEEYWQNNPVDPMRATDKRLMWFESRLFAQKIAKEKERKGIDAGEFYPKYPLHLDFIRPVYIFTRMPHNLLGVKDLMVELWTDVEGQWPKNSDDSNIYGIEMERLVSWDENDDRFNATIIPRKTGEFTFRYTHKNRTLRDWLIDWAKPYGHNGHIILTDRLIEQIQTKEDTPDDNFRKAVKFNVGKLIEEEPIQEAGTDQAESADMLQKQL